MRESLGFARRAEAVGVSLVLAIAAVGLALLPLTSPIYVRALVGLVDSSDLTGLGTEMTLEVAEQVRRFVLDVDAPRLPATIDGRPAFDDEAVGHLVDVRDVLVPARALTLVSAVVAAAWLALRGRRQRVVRSAALRASGWLLAITLAGAAAVGLTDFDAFFTWFHGLFFAPGTWTFPSDALLIQVFPLPFWTISAGVWAVLVLVGTGLLFSFAHGLRFTRTKDGV